VFTALSAIENLINQQGNDSMQCCQDLQNRFQQTWTILEQLDLNVSVSCDLSGVFTALEACCEDVQDKFEQTWTIISALDLNVTVSCDFGGVFTALDGCCEDIQDRFRQTWTIISALDLSVTVLEVFTALSAIENLINQQGNDSMQCCQDLQNRFQQTWTILEQLDLNVSVSCDLSGIFTALEACCEDVQDKFEQTWTMVEAGFDSIEENQFQLFCESQLSFQETWTMIDALDVKLTVSCDFNGVFTSLEACCEGIQDRFEETWTVIESCCDRLEKDQFQLFCETQLSFQETWTILNETVCAATPITTAVYTISQPGTYCLAIDIPTGGSITIASDNVVLDLNGHRINGTSGTSVISSSGTHKNIVIKNGFIQGTIANGIALTTSSNVTIDDVMITGVTSNALSISSTSNDITIARVVIDTAAINGISVNGSNNIFIHDVQVRQVTGANSNGVVLTGCTNSTVQRVEIVGGTSLAVGINIHSSVSTIIQDLQVSSFTTTGIGVAINSSSDTMVTNCIVDGGSSSGYDGIVVSGSLSNNLQNIQITNVTNTGITVSSSSHNTKMVNVTVEASPTTPISLSASKNCVLQDASIHSTATTTNGILLASGCDNTVIKNVVLDLPAVATNGIQLAASSVGVTIDGAIIRGVGAASSSGILVASACNDCTITNVTIDAPAINGISVTSCTNVLVTNAKIKSIAGTSSTGVLFSSSNGCTITDVTMDAPAVKGISVTSCTNVSVTNAKIKSIAGTSSSGVLLSLCTNSMMKNVEIAGATTLALGVSLSSCASTSVQDLQVNTFATTGTGLSISSSNDTMVTNCIIDGGGSGGDTGIVLLGSLSNNLENVQIKSVINDGIVVAASSHNTKMVTVTIDSNVVTMIVVGLSKNCLIQDFIAHSTAMTTNGIVLANGSDNTVIKNAVLDLPASATVGIQLSASSVGVTIDGAIIRGVAGVNSSGIVVASGCNDCTITNVTIDAPAINGISVTSCANISVTNGKIKSIAGTSSNGVLLSSCSNSMVKNVEIVGATTLALGVLLSSCASTLIQDLQVNTFATTGTGLSISSSNDTMVTNCIIDGGSSNGSNGIVISASPSSNLQNVLIKSIGGSSSSGILLSSSTNNMMRNVQVTGTTTLALGVSLSSCTTTSIQDLQVNTFATTGKGLLISSSNDTMVTNCAIDGGGATGDTGIYLTGSSLNNLKNIQIRNVTGTNIYITAGCTQTTVSEADINAAINGIVIAGSSANTIIKNSQINGITTYGMYLDTCSGTEILNCNFVNNIASGVRVIILDSNCTGVHIANNTIVMSTTNTSVVGIASNTTGHSGIVIEHNQILVLTGSGGYGISINGGADSTKIIENVVNGNSSAGCHGINLTATRGVIQGNKVSGFTSTTSDGIRVTTDGFTIIDKNQVNNCYNNFENISTTNRNGYTNNVSMNAGNANYSNILAGTPISLFNMTTGVPSGSAIAWANVSWTI
jgi:hypothetical protein